MINRSLINHEREGRKGSPVEEKQMEGIPTKMGLKQEKMEEEEKK